jgi:flagellar protein FlaG
MVSVTASLTNVQSSAHSSHTASAGGVSVVEKISSAKSTKVDNSPESSLDIPKLVNELNDISQKEPLSVSFGYDEELGKVFINVVDKNSGEVIRKLPSEEAMKFAKSIKETVGKLLDKRG